MKKPFRYERRRTSAQSEFLVFFDDHGVIEDQLHARHVFEIIKNDNPLRDRKNVLVTGLWFREYGFPTFLGTSGFTEEQFRESTVVEEAGKQQEFMIYIPWI